ncbi:MAG TPA: SDR family NAD(P)-dependent oxidoreductase [Candidatus Limnocylindrales bacterium]
MHRAGGEHEASRQDRGRHRGRERHGARGRARAAQAGARVAAIDINDKTLGETVALAPGGAEKIATYVLNITDRSAVEALPQAVVDRFGSVDGIINCAGIIQPFVRLNDLEYAAIDRVMDVNFRGTLYMKKSFLPWLLKRPEAHIVNVSNMGGFMPVPGQTIYGASRRPSS